MNDPTAPAGDRLRAMEQLESRALGKPKEAVVREQEEPETLRILREASNEELERLIRGETPPEAPTSN